MTSIALESLSPLARKLALESLAWMEPYGDPACNLLWYPGKHGHYAHYDIEKVHLHLVRESTWWAIGLLLRNQGDDVARAHRVLDEVLQRQINEPGQPYHGTFLRAPEETPPTPQHAYMWGNYDPNWRQFIGTSFIVILETFSDRLTPDLADRLLTSLRPAVEGEEEGSPTRITAEYSNIAMLKAVLLVYAGERLGEPAWTAKGLTLARQVYELFAEHETFAEYNSPTYYGVVLYGLRLWRLLSNHPEMERWGVKMESSLWTHIALYYHPGLRNICGPYDRSYGMDMTKYSSAIAIWMLLELDPQHAPFPLLNQEFEHAHDFTFAPVAALLGVEIPVEVKAHLREFQRERVIDQVIESEPKIRTATAYLKPHRMWGAESGGTKLWSQFHPATAHWLQPDGTLAWMRLENLLEVDAVACVDGLQVTSSPSAKPSRLIWHLSTGVPPQIEPGEWKFPGLTVDVKTNLPDPRLEEGETGLYSLIYEVPAEQGVSLKLEFLS